MIRRALDPVPGVRSLHADMLQHTLRVELDPDQLDTDAIIGAIGRIGFEVRPHEPAEARSSRSQYAGPKLTTLSGGALLLIAATVHIATGETSMAVALTLVASTVISGLPVAQAAWRAVRARALEMNALMTIAAIGAVGIGEYFEAATAMFLFGVSLWLESLSMDRARRAVRSLVRLMPTVAHRMVDGSIEDVDPAELQVGVRIVVRPGERIPVDGTVATGRSAVNQAPITGESVPVEKSPGEQVFAGTLNGEGSLEVVALCTTEASTLAHIGRLVKQARTTRSRTERYVDRFARRYTPAVIAAAVIVALGGPLAAELGMAWAANLDAAAWFHRGLVLLVVACPCALVISTPVTIVCGLAHAARRGILIKGGEHLENAGRIDAMALDKTGTLTTGSIQVVSIDPVAGHSADELLQVAAALEQHSEHPLAAAIVSAAEERGMRLPAATGFLAKRGFGVQAEIHGETFLVGSRRMIGQHVTWPGTETLDSPEEDPTTMVFVATNDAPWGVIHLADAPRDDAQDAIAQLDSLGIAPMVMLTGDSRAVADHIAGLLGIDRADAELLPEDKVARVRELADRYPQLAMVGDGVNDAPALAASRLGIALGGGASDTAMETADVVITSGKLGRLIELVRLGRRCRRTLGQNITLALSLKAVVAVAAVAGLASLWMAVAADVGASLLVIFNGMRLTVAGRE